MKILPCKEYVEYFLDGKLYCNTVRYFRDKRYDEFEGADFLHPTTLRLDSHTIPEEDLAGPVILHSNFVADLNVFCMFAWRAPKVGDDDVLYCNTVRVLRDKRYDEFEGADFLHPTTLRRLHTIPEEDLAGPVSFTRTSSRTSMFSVCSLGEHLKSVTTMF